MDINQLKRQRAWSQDRAKQYRDELADGGMGAALAEETERKAEHHEQVVRDYTVLIDAAENDREESARLAEARGGNSLGLSSPPSFGRTPTIDTNRPMPMRDFLAADNLDDAGFDSLSDMLAAVYGARSGSMAFDERLGVLKSASSQTGESNPYGGFLVPTAYQQSVIQSAVDEEPWLGMIDGTILPDGVGATSWPQLADRDQSAGDVGGVELKGRSETSDIATSTLTIEARKLDLATFGTLVYVTQELLQDSPRGSVDALIRNVFGTAVTKRMAEDVLNGNTPGKPNGIINHTGTYVVAKEGGQAANTINGTNILKMRARLKPSSLARSVWLANPDSYLQLVADHTTLTSDDYPMFIHGNGTDVPDTLLGRPIYFTSYASTLGDKGDIVLCDLSKYQVQAKPMLVDTSPHLRFDKHELAYKCVIRHDGGPVHNATFKDRRNYETSEFVTLAERA